MTCKMTLDVKDLQKHIKDDFVSKGEIVNGNTLKLTREQGGTVEVTLPEGQKITSFDLVNRGGKNVLELKTSDSKTFTAYLPETPQGGGGTDLHINGFEYNPKVVGGVSVAHKLTISRSDGKTFDVEIPIRPKGEGGPDKYLEELTTDTPPSETSFRANAGRFYFTKNVEVTGRLNSGTEIKSKQPWNKLYWSEADTTDPSRATEKRPIMDIFATDGGQSLSVVRDDATTNTIRLQAGGGSGGGGIKDVAPSTTKSRTIVITDANGDTKEVTLPDNWFTGRDGRDGRDGKDGFVSVEEYNALAEKTILSSWAASAIRPGFDTTEYTKGIKDYSFFGTFTTAAGTPTPFQIVNQHESVSNFPRRGNDYTVVLLNQPGDTGNSSHKHVPLPYLRVIGQEGALKAIDVFEWMLANDSGTSKILRAVYRGTVYAQDDIGNGILLYPVAGMYLPGYSARGDNYASQMPPTYEFCVRDVDAVNDAAYDPSVVFKNSYQISPTSVRPVF